ncbi:hypothetical protein GCK32_022633, partial [Trichostrongylus colubriformis]
QNSNRCIFCFCGGNGFNSNFDHYVNVATTTDASYLICPGGICRTDH